MTDPALLDKLLHLRLPAFREGLREQQANPQFADLSFEERLALLVDQELTRRHDNRIRKSLRTAAFPFQAAPEELEMTTARGLDRKQILELAQCAWIGNHLGILVVGPTGSGKTFVACSLATSALRMGYSVRYYRSSRLLHTLELSRQDGSYSTLLRSLAKIDLLILDDWLRDPLSQVNAQDLLEVLDDRYGHASTMVVSQMPIAEWFTQIPNPTLADACLDRLLHCSYRIQLQGESQRKLRSPIRTMSHT
jgi:DNA replication protein DnaC